MPADKVGVLSVGGSKLYDFNVLRDCGIEAGTPVAGLTPETAACGVRARRATARRRAALQHRVDGVVIVTNRALACPPPRLISYAEDPFTATMARTKSGRSRSKSEIQARPADAPRRLHLC